MALILTEEQTMVRDQARAFLADKAGVAHLRKLRDSRDPLGFSRDLWKAFAEMGFCGILVPEPLGGCALLAVGAAGYIVGQDVVHPYAWRWCHRTDRDYNTTAWRQHCRGGLEWKR